MAVIRKMAIGHQYRQPCQKKTPINIAITDKPCIHYFYQFCLNTYSDIDFNLQVLIFTYCEL